MRRMFEVNDISIKDEQTFFEMDTISKKSYGTFAVKGIGKFRFHIEAGLDLNGITYWGTIATSPVEPNAYVVMNPSDAWWFPFFPAFSADRCEKVRVRIKGDGIVSWRMFLEYDD